MSSGKIEATIRNKLHTALEATHLEIVNESHLHNVPAGSETHFRVVVVSKKFEDLPSLKRHQLVNDTLREEIRGGVQALSIVAKTPEQWEAARRAEGSPARRASLSVTRKRMNSAEFTRWP